MNVYIEALESRRKIVRLYENANKSKNAKDYTRFQSMGDIAVGDWIQQYGSLDTAELNRQSMLPH